MKFETYKTKSGDFHWRLREDSGKLVTVKPGKIRGIPDSPAKKKHTESVPGLSVKSSPATGANGGRKPPGRLKTAKA